MGNVPLPEAERDKKLIKDYLLKDEDGWFYSIPQLCFKYARQVGDRVYPLSATRVHQILTKHGVKKERVK